MKIFGFIIAGLFPLFTSFAYAQDDNYLFNRCDAQKTEENEKYGALQVAPTINNSIIYLVVSQIYAECKNDTKIMILSKRINDLQQQLNVLAHKSK